MAKIWRSRSWRKAKLMPSTKARAREASSSRRVANTPGFGARLASYVAIAKGDVPDSHWFHLGRLLTSVDGAPTLLSWSASLFEYLMPLLVMQSYPGTLLDQSCRMAVRRQMEYGRQQGVPWGISESAFNLVDRHGNYQYKAFGVP